MKKNARYENNTSFLIEGSNTVSEIHNSIACATRAKTTKTGIFGEYLQLEVYFYIL